MLNYLFVNLLIILALYILWTKNPTYQQHLLVIVVALALLYNFGTYNEGFQDFSQRTRASLDIFCWQKENLEDKNSPMKFVCQPGQPERNEKDRCHQCDGLCLQGATGQNFPPGAQPLCHQHPLVKNQTGFYRIQSTQYPKKYLAYDLQGLDGNGILLYLAQPANKTESALPDLVWKLERDLDTFRISTSNQPPLYLEGKKRGTLGMSYFKTGKWQILQGANNTVLISTADPKTLYLTSDGNQVSLGSYLHYWQLEKFDPNQSTVITPPAMSPLSPAMSPTSPLSPAMSPMSPLSPAMSSLRSKDTQEGFVNVLQFPDTPGQVPSGLKNYGSLADWNQYYSQYWNGEYTYKNTTPTNKDYLTIHLNLDGSGTVSTKDEKWTVTSVGADLVYGENTDSYLYVEMLTDKKAGQYYNPDQPQVKIIVKKKNTLHPEIISLVTSDPNNFNAYSYKIGIVGENVKNYPMEKFQNQSQSQSQSQPIVDLRFLGINLLDANLGYNLPQVELNSSKPCNLGPPTQVPVNTNRWSKIDQTGKLKQSQPPNLPLEIRYTYRYQCEDGTIQESLPSPSLNIPRSISRDGHYYGALIKVFGDPSKNISSIRIYSRPTNTKAFSLSQEITQNSPEVTVPIVPTYLQKIVS